MTATNRELLDAWVEALEDNHDPDLVVGGELNAARALLTETWGYISSGNAVPLKLRRELKEYFGIRDIYRTTRGET